MKLCVICPCDSKDKRNNINLDKDVAFFRCMGVSRHIEWARQGLKDTPIHVAIWSST